MNAHSTLRLRGPVDGRPRLQRSAVLLLIAVCNVIWLQQPASAQRAPLVDVGAQTFEDLRRWDAYVVSHQKTGDLGVVRIDADPMVPGRKVERFRQSHQGVPIWGGEVVRDSANDVAVAIFGSLAPDLTLSTQPGLSADAALAIFQRLNGSRPLAAVAPTLVIVPLDDGSHRLAYTTVLFGDVTADRVFIDANSGAELLRYSELHTQQPAIGLGTGALGDPKKLSTLFDQGTFFAFDMHRPPVIQTYDMRGNLARAKEAEIFGLSASETAQDSDNTWVDPAIVDAHVHVSWTYDYFFKRFGRTGLDGRDQPIFIMTNALTPQAALNAPVADANWAVNAFWCGLCNAGRGLLFFGNGIPREYYSLGSGHTVGYLAGALDVAAHELTHGVTDASSGLIYRNESGALNEAFSDIMGTSVEFFYQPPGAGPGLADYSIAEDASQRVVGNIPDGHRSMENPAAFGDPDHYSRRYLGPEDNGGIHHNSGIVNQAFYLAVEGGANRTSGLRVQGVGASNREQIERVFFRAFVSLLPASASFSTARAATIQAARELYGSGSAVERAITDAWTAVGVN